MEKTRQRARTSAIRPVLMIPLVAAIGLLALFGCAPGHPVSSGKAVPVAVGSKGSVPVPPPGSSSQPPTRPRTASAANPVQTVPGARDLTQQTIDGQPAFGVVGRAPFVESLTLTGATHTVDGVVAVGQKDQVVLHWIVATNQPLALDHVVFAADHQEKATTALPADGIVLPPDAQALPLPNLADGRWYLHLWAVDQAGQISPPATVAVSVLRTPPELSHAVYRSWATNPLYQTVPIRFTVSRAATLAVSIVPDASETPLRTYHLANQPADHEIRLSWDGKDDRGQIVPPGAYRLLIEGTDPAGNQVRALDTGITITNKVIRVSLTQQSMAAFDGSQLFLTTLVTTGGQALPTRAGQYEILEKATPFVFHSPYPKGSPYWFADVTSNRAMLFDPRDANFIHDAPWRTIYGPGTNGPGIPGQVYTGSHGCVETPTAALARLYAWTPLGTPVLVSP